MKMMKTGTIRADFRAAKIRKIWNPTACRGALSM
jgi:hypothetical protein